MNSKTGRAAPDNDRSDDIDLTAILDTIINDWRLILSTTLIALFVAGAYVLIAKPVYQASLLVQVEDNVDSSAKSLLGDVSSLFNVKSSADTEIQILGSQMIVGATVDNLALYVEAEPRYFPLIGRRIARDSEDLSIPGLFGWGGFAWGNESITVKDFVVPPSFEDDKFVLTSLGGGNYRLTGEDMDQPMDGQIGRRQVFGTKKGNIELELNSLRANTGTKFKLIRHSRLKTISKLQDELNISEQGKDSGVISAVWQATDRKQVAETMNEIGRLYEKQNVDRKSAEAEKSLAFLATQVPVFKRELEDAEVRYNAARTRIGSVDLDEDAKVALQQATDIETRRLQLVQQRRALSVNLADTHPDIISLDAQIATLTGQDQQLRQRIKVLPNAEQEIIRLMRDVQVDTNLYIALLNNVQQLTLLKAGKVGNVRVIDHAVVPVEPVKPKKVIVFPAAGVAGLFLGVVCAFLREGLFRGVDDPHEIESHAGISVYATVPYSLEERVADAAAKHVHGRSPLLAINHPKEPAIESLRSFRTALQFAMLDAKNNVVLLTGPAPGVGKSFVSANFAAVMAASGKRVLLIDCDLRKGRLHGYYDIDRGRGFSELLLNQISFEEAITKGVDGLPDFIPTGILPPNPAELLLSDRLRHVIDRLSAMYDMVIIDTPPVLAVADAGIVAALVGTVFLVTMAGRSKIGEIVESEKRLAQSGVALKGVLLNGLRPRQGRYGYGSKYGAYRYVAYSYDSGKRGK